VLSPLDRWYNGVVFGTYSRRIWYRMAKF